MSDTVAVALITNATIIIVAFLSRLWSHVEHRKTERTTQRTEEKIDILVNGTLKEDVHAKGRREG